MEENNKERVSLLTAIEHYMVNKGIQDFNANDALQSIDAEAIENYLKHKEGDDLCTLEDAETEMKISTYLLRHLHEKAPKNSQEENILYCRRALTIMRNTKLQLWYANEKINEATYKKLCRKQKWAEILSEAKYRAKVAPIGAALGAVVGFVAAVYCGLEILLATAVVAAIGLVLFLFLPKKSLIKLKEYGREQILPKLKEAVDQAIDTLTQKIPKILNEVADNIINRVKGGLRRPKNDVEKENIDEKVNAFS